MDPLTPSRLKTIPVPTLDFHNHLIPGVDDGAQSIEASKYGMRTMAAQGATHIVTTPHLRASLVAEKEKFQAYLRAVETSWQQLVDASDSIPELEIARGFEILLDSPALDLSNPLLRLGGSVFTLVEFPFVSIPPRSVEALFNLKIQGYTPIVAHPERYADVQNGSSPIDEWSRIGAYFQGNAGSFLGHYGRPAQKTAWKLLELGMLSYVCSDFHAAGECHARKAFEAIESKHGLGVATLLFSSNPLRIPRNEAPLAVEVPRKKGLFQRFRRGYKP